MSKAGEIIVETEWSHFFDAAGMDSKRAELSISPNAEERHRLALRLGITSLDDLKADIVVHNRSGDISYQVKGKFKAEITQACVVTLEPIKSTIREEFEAWFADPKGPVSFTKLKHEREAARAHGEVPLLEEKDDPEPLVAGKIDLGELVTQFLSLAINPYPHAEGVSFEAAAPVGPGESPELLKNPFVALKDWKKQLKDDQN